MNLFSSSPSVVAIVLLALHQCLQQPHVTALSAFILTPCSQPSVEDVLGAKLLKMTHTRYIANCAFTCAEDERCGYAVFHGVNTYCSFIEDDNLQINTSLLGGSSDNGLFQDTCLVLSKLKDNTSTTEKGLEGGTWTQIDPANFQDMHDAMYTPLKLVEYSSDQIDIHHVSYISIDETFTLRIASFVRGLEFSVTNEMFVSPLLQVVRYVVGGLDPLWTIPFSNKGQTNGVTKTHNPLVLLKKRMGLENGRVKDMAIVDSVETITAALKSGYRRLERHPHRVVIDGESPDIHFDMTETLILHGEGEFAVSDKYYCTSIKESYSSTVRYLLRHQINNGSTLPAVLTTFNPMWIMDTSWSELEPGNNVKEIVVALKRHVTDGKDLRIMIGGKMVSDLTSIRLTSSDVIVSLAQYLTPFTMTNNTLTDKQNVNFQVVSASKTYTECEMDFQGDVVHNVTYDVISDDIKWFVSTRSWTKLLEVDINRSVILGSRDALYDEALKGKDIRVCVVISTSGSSYCYGAVSVQLVTTTKHVLVRTPSVIGHTNTEDGPLAVNSEACNRKVKVISSEGWVKSVPFVIGKGDKSQRVDDFMKIIWHVEYG